MFLRNFHVIYLWSSVIMIINLFYIKIISWIFQIIIALHLSGVKYGQGVGVSTRSLSGIWLEHRNSGGFCNYKYSDKCCISHALQRLSRDTFLNLRLLVLSTIFSLQNVKILTSFQWKRNKSVFVNFRNHT